MFTNEEARYQHKPAYKAIVSYIKSLKIFSRCAVLKGIEAYYENGELATQDILAISYNMPLKIELLLPTAEVERVLPSLEKMLTEGIIAVRELDIYCHKLRKYFIPKHIPVRDVMTASPKTVQPFTSVDHVVKLLLSSIFTGVPVVDTGKEPVGVVTQTDLIYRAGIPIKLSMLPGRDVARLEEFLGNLSRRKAEEVMTRPAVTINQDKMLTDAVALMIENQVKRLVVVDEAGKIVGILSRMDIFQAISRESPNWEAFREKKVALSNLRFVSDIMRRDTISVLANVSLEDVLKKININDLEAIAVVSEDDKLLGMVFEHDLLNFFAVHKVSIWEFLSQKISFHKKGTIYERFVETLQEKTAAEVMKTDLITVYENAEIDEAIGLMSEKRIKRLPVISKDGKFRGLINRESLLRAAIKKQSL